MFNRMATKMLAALLLLAPVVVFVAETGVTSGISWT